MPPKSKLLSEGDIRPFGIENPESPSGILFLSDHAGRAIPAQLGDLGLDEAELSRHIGYDIGIYGVTSRMARALGATYIFQPYSRLVIDCNRKPGKPQSVREQSDGTHVPGNAGLSPEDIRAREDEILWPYQRQIETELSRRAAVRQTTAIFSMHSCTDRLRVDDRERPWQISVIANTDWRIATPLIDVLRAETDLTVGVNEPYTVDMEMDFTLPVHAEGGNIPYVEIEIRQDLISDEAGQTAWADLLTKVFPLALARAAIGED